MDEKTRIYTVSEITRRIKSLVESEFPAVWVEGEISNFIKHTSGHMYFSLKDENSVLPAVLFRNVSKDLKFEPASGQHVLCFGRISVYEKRGAHQIYVDRMEPKGLGALQLALQQLTDKLKKEGLFDPAHKKTIPFLPERVGIVTSPTGAAVRDIIHVATRRFPGVALTLIPAKVQGAGAAEEIAAAIRLFNGLGNVDVIIAGRGGGSLEDLWPFNEEIVARAIYDSEIPVVSAVGHEVDWTIADFVADMRAPTPSAAAEIVVPVAEALFERLDDAVSRLKSGLVGLVDEHAQRVDDLAEASTLRMGHVLSLKEEALRSIIGKLEAMSPLAVLKRGYSITESAKTGQVIKAASDARPGDAIKTRLSKGVLISRVEKTEKDSNRQAE